VCRSPMIFSSGGTCQSHCAGYPRKYPQVPPDSAGQL
jgi:hypothetical protein